MRIRHIAQAALLLLLSVARAEAQQADSRFLGIPHLAAPDEVSAMMGHRGYRIIPREFNLPLPDRLLTLRFASDGGTHEAYAHFLDGRLTSISLHWEDADRTRFAAIADSLVRLRGRPSKRDSTSFSWTYPPGENSVNLNHMGQDGSVWLDFRADLNRERSSILIDALTSGSSTPRFAELSERWHIAHEQSDVRLATDRSIIRLEPGVYRVWERWEWVEAQELDLSSRSVRYDWSMTRRDYDCRGRRSRTVEAAYRLGEVLVYSYMPEDLTWYSPQPETLGEIAMDAACKLGESLQ